METAGNLLGDYILTQSQFSWYNKKMSEYESGYNLNSEQPAEGESFGGEEIYVPTEAVRRVLTFNPDLLAEIRSKSPQANELGLVERYCKTIDHRIAEVELDPEKARSADDGNNIIYTAIMYANFKAAGDIRKFAAEGQDLEVVNGMLKDKIDREYSNLSSYKLWTELYLGLREALLGSEQNEENIEMINQLREMITN